MKNTQENKSKIKVGTVVIAPCNSLERDKDSVIQFKKGDELTVTKVELGDWSPIFGQGFWIKDRYCLETGCAQINGMNWIIK